MVAGDRGSTCRRDIPRTILAVGQLVLRSLLSRVPCLCGAHGLIDAEDRSDRSARAGAQFDGRPDYGCAGRAQARAGMGTAGARVGVRRRGGRAGSGRPMVSGACRSVGYSTRPLSAGDSASRGRAGLASAPFGE